MKRGREQGREAYTALERHAAFFDRRGVGLIRPRDTYGRIRDLGVGMGLSFGLTALIHVFLGPMTSRAPRLVIDVRKIHLGIHASDTGIFGADGQIVDAAFDRLFEEAHDGVGDPKDPEATVRRRDLVGYMRAHGPQSKVAGFFSWAEASLLYCVGADRTRPGPDGEPEPAFSRRRLRSFYEGRLLHVLARRRRIIAARAR